MTSTNVTLEDLSVPAPPPGPDDWTDTGVVYLRGLLPDDLIEAYQEEWMASNGYRALDWPESYWSADVKSLVPQVLDAERPGGWDDTCPYMDHPALRELCTYGPLAEQLERLLGEPAGLHLNLTGWVSTERRWHQDGYLNPEHVGDRYAAVWMALDDINPSSGPFEYIEGSHRWHRLTRERLAASGLVDMSDPAWPAHTEAVLTPLVEEEMRRRGASPTTYVPSKGDVLIWHPRLYHQGSAPTVPNAYRPALIAHYSGVRTAKDFPLPAVKLGEERGWMFPIHQRGGMGRTAETAGMAGTDA